MPGTNAGTGRPIVFACAKCRRRTGGISNMLRDGHGWQPTGNRRVIWIDNAGNFLRVDVKYQYEYECTYTPCCHIGWSRHDDVRRRYNRMMGLKT